MVDQNISTRSDGPRPAVDDAARAEPPQQIGRYRVRQVLGEGNFGLVYLANDEQLERLVAIKVPHPKLVTSADDAKAYLIEARTVAHLDHPNIVPVHDVGSTEQFPCYIVSKYIDGTDLASRLQQSRLSVHQAVDLAATVAEALHHAHTQRLVHRDVKPGNILLDKSGKPFVGDFGLALREQDVGTGPRFAGTPAYMSPEQARGEGHRVDGRSDIFSLGIVLYEMLTGQRPFHADTRDHLLETIAGIEACPPRQMDDTIPKELERIVLKALAKRAAERYMTARDLSDDLRHFLEDAFVEEKSKSTTRTTSATNVATPTAPVPDSHPVKIVPKGLRSFDAHDADFFLELLPGPRDREGLPDSLRFWKTLIEEADADSSFTVGVIYGPSGCGKSSLMKAGLLPRLAADVIAVYVEATADETETRLLNGLRKKCPALPTNLALKNTLAALRRGQGIPAGKKVLIVLDQFEQWLHARKQEENTQLVQALRQCDGARVQCVVMVRDDFWMAVTRFLAQLEIDLLQGRNCAAADLFDIDHALKVLAAFGRAFGKLPEKTSATNEEQMEFLNKAVSGLSEENKIICVRLALFAEMMKGRPWTPATLKEVGGTEGVGIAFLEDTFASRAASPRHRLHQKAARAVLKALLPEAGTDIKGFMRSYAELLEASNYADRRMDFDDVIRMLDNEIRLITPTDPEGKEDLLVHVEAHEKYYQLTHDYLVPALRQWLTGKQQETNEGRAELLLEECTRVWNARQDNRLLPSLPQWLDIRSLTQEQHWTERQRKMMEEATKHHVQAALDRLLNASTIDVPNIVMDMEPYRRWIDHRLQKAFMEAEADHDARKQLHASLALLPVDRGQIAYLLGRLLDAEPQELSILRDALAPCKSELQEKLWRIAGHPSHHEETQRLRAASALATYDPDSMQWDQIQDRIADDFVSVPTAHLPTWLALLHPVRAKLLSALARVFRDEERRETERSLATAILAEYAAADPAALADLLMDADEAPFAVFYARLNVHGERGVRVLQAAMDEPVPTGHDAKEPLAKRQANAAAALLRMNRPAKVWPLLKHSPDPRVRSYLIHRFGPLGCDAGAIVARLADEPDVTIRRALLLSLGEFGEKEISPDLRATLLPKLQTVYRTEADPGLHGAAEWLLRTWQESPWLEQVNEEWAKDKERQAQNLGSIEQLCKTHHEHAPPQWYVNGQGQTMVVIPGPAEFLMGSPVTEAHRIETEVQCQTRIERAFAIAAKHVTLGQVLTWRKDFFGTSTPLARRYAPRDDCPAVMVSWHDAARYCNWLSAQEGIDADQWYYETSDDVVTALKKDWLHLTGYRLPTDAEMAYATRAGTSTARSFGETEELLPKYAWYQSNSAEKTWPVGSLKPNDFGLFDVHGNVFTWCQDVYKGADRAEDAQEDDLIIVGTRSRVLRGGSFNNQASLVRCAYRYNNVPSNRFVINGFRVARTLPQEV